MQAGGRKLAQDGRTTLACFLSRQGSGAEATKDAAQGTENQVSTASLQATQSQRSRAAGQLRGTFPFLQGNTSTPTDSVPDPAKGPRL